MKPPGAQGSQSTYTDLLSVIEEMGKEIRPTYAGSKSAMERLKRGRGDGVGGWGVGRHTHAPTHRLTPGPACPGVPLPGVLVVGIGGHRRETDVGCLSASPPPPAGIIHARALVRECLAETERNART